MSTQDTRVKFLIIRFSSIGDIVLTTPVIRHLKVNVANAEVHYLTKQAFAPVLENNPYIDKLHVLDKDFNGLVRTLKSESFDYIIDLHKNLRTLRVKKALKRMSFSFDKLNFKKWMLVNLKINKMPTMHIVERYMQTIKLFIDQPDGQGLDYFIPQKDQYTLPFSDKFVSVVIGANHFTKQLPDKKIIELCEGIDKPIVLIGGKADREKSLQIEKSLTKKITNLVGQLTINQSASVVKQSEWIITPDTGLMHIAAAFKKKIISVWGNTVPEFGMYPYMPDKQSVMIEEKGLNCRPCSKIGFAKCPKGHFNCMQKHNMQNVISHIKF
jgi:heptosyltransferase-2